MISLDFLFDLPRTRVRKYIMNPLLNGVRKKRINYKKFSIISNNCWGGLVYQFFKYPYDSPTVGLYFFPEEYIRFLKDLRHYISSPLEIIPASESRYIDELKMKHEENKIIGKIDDVEIVFLHYKTPEEALTKWNRRKARIHWDNLIVKFSEQNGCTLEHLRQFDTLPFEKKLVFTHKDYGLKSQVIYREFKNQKEVPNDTMHFSRYVDLINLVNGLPYKI